MTYQELSIAKAQESYTAALAEVDAVLAPREARLAELDAVPTADLAANSGLTAERQRLLSEVATNSAKRTSLQLAARLDQGIPSKVITPAALPGAPVAPKPVRNTVIAFFVGVVLMLGLVFLLDYLDDRLRDRAAIAKVAPRLATLAIIPRHRRAARSTGSLAGEPGPVGEAIRGLRASVQFAGLSRPLHSILVTSSKPKEGKSTLALSLAIAFARNGTKTVLVDADLRKPRAHRYLGIDDNSHGLSTVLRGEALVEPGGAGRAGCGEPGGAHVGPGAGEPGRLPVAFGRQRCGAPLDQGRGRRVHPGRLHGSGRRAAGAAGGRCPDSVTSRRRCGVRGRCRFGESARREPRLRAAVSSRQRRSWV